MRLVVIAIGRLKQGPERELAERYRERSTTSAANSDFAALRFMKYRKVAHATPPPGLPRRPRRYRRQSPRILLVALDERGDNIDSGALARHLARWRDDQVANTIFLIGGADGLSPHLRRMAKLRLAFGFATWPHQMVRVMLLEQVDRAATILAGHPYHRA